MECFQTFLVWRVLKQTLENVHVCQFTFNPGEHGWLYDKSRVVEIQSYQRDKNKQSLCAK